MITFSYEPSILAVNKPSLLLSLRTIAAALYIGVAFFLLQTQDIYAFAYAFLASQICYVVLFSVLGQHELKKRLNAVDSA